LPDYGPDQEPNVLHPEKNLQIRGSIMHSLYGSLLAGLLAIPLLAQQTAKPNALLLREGEEVCLKFTQSLTSKVAVVDDTVEFVLADDLRVGDAIVAKAGAKAVGTVTNAQRAGMFGKGAELAVRLDYLKVGAVKVKLRGSRAREGQSAQGSAIALTVLLGPIGLFKHGKEINIAEGTPLKGFVSSDVSLDAI
jgi:hypothetical protein